MIDLWCVTNEYRFGYINGRLIMLPLLLQVGLIFGPHLYNMTDRSIDVVYETATPQATEVHYVDSTTWTFDVARDNAIDIHNVHLAGLQPDTLYYYAIREGNNWSPIRFFWTMPTTLRRPMRFAIWGDNQVGQNIFARHIINFLLEGCVYWIGAGDYIQNSELREEWSSKFDIPTQGLNAYLPLIGCRGNHDFETPYAYRYFKVPDGGNSIQWGAITVGPIRFVVLDTNQTPELITSLLPNGAQRNWLLNEVGSNEWNNARFRIVIYHHPHRINYWDAGCYYGNSGNEPLLVDLVYNILVPARTSLIINGHSHSFSAGRIGDTYHVITGGGGGFLDSALCWQQQHFFSFGFFYHFLTIDVLGDRLVVRCVKQDRSVFTEFTIMEQ